MACATSVQGWPGVVARQDGSIWLERDGDVQVPSAWGPPTTSRRAPRGLRDVLRLMALLEVRTRGRCADGTDWAPDTPRVFASHSPPGTRGWFLDRASGGPDLGSWTIAPDGTVWAAYRAEDGKRRGPTGSRRVGAARGPTCQWATSSSPRAESSGSVEDGGVMERRDDGSWRVYEGVACGAIARMTARGKRSRSMPWCATRVNSGSGSGPTARSGSRA